MSTPSIIVPPMPKRIDDHLWRKLSKAVGSDRAFTAVDAAWEAIVELGLYKPEREVAS